MRLSAKTFAAMLIGLALAAFQPDLDAQSRGGSRSSSTSRSSSASASRPSGSSTSRPSGSSDKKTVKPSAPASKPSGNASTRPSGTASKLQAAHQYDLPELLQNLPAVHRAVRLGSQAVRCQNLRADHRLISVLLTEIRLVRLATSLLAQSRASRL